MTRVLPVNLQLGAGILLDTLFPLFTLSVSVREKPLVRLIVTKTPSMDLLPRDVLLLTHSLTHSVHLIALDSLRDCRAPPKRGKEKVGQESDDTEEKPGSASAVCTSRILLLLSVLSFTVYHNFLELKVEPKQEPVLQQSTLRVARQCKTRQHGPVTSSTTFHQLTGSVLPAATAHRLARTFLHGN